jgi:protein-S-isoprenylcysteine O-methyltransferase Ste14
MSDRIQILEAKIPPPIVMLVMGFLAWVAARYLPALSFQFLPNRAIASALAILGLALNVYPKLVFDRAGTTINPLKPSSTTCLVTSGIYGYTRNPMYLGQSLMLLGWTMYLHNLAGLVAVPAFIIYISQFQIRPEERVLAARFPEEFAAFCKQTRRWL